MTTLPRDTVLVRTWFGSADAWNALVSAVATPNEDGFLARPHVIDDVAFDGMRPEQLITHDLGNAAVSFLADETTLTGGGYPVLAVHIPLTGSAESTDCRTFRVIAAELWSVENNLSIANMDWSEFADATDPDGVFRGF